MDENRESNTIQSIIIFSQKFQQILEWNDPETVFSF